jgi:hypothetical protein
VGATTRAARSGRGDTEAVYQLRPSIPAAITIEAASGRGSNSFHMLARVARPLAAMAVGFADLAICRFNIA